MKKTFYIILGIVAILVIYALGSIIVNRLFYEDALQKINNIKGVETCESVPSFVYGTSLIFNTPDRQTYYFRSDCYQKVAVRNRDEQLCDRVKERKSIFLNGSGISREACLVAVKKQKDQDFSARVKPESVHKIEKVEVTRTPAGDFFIKAFPVGNLWGSYKFSVSLLDNSGKFIGVLDENSPHMSNIKYTLGVTVYRRKIQALVGSPLCSGQTYILQISLKLLRDDAGQLGRSNLSPTQLESAKNESITF